LDRLDEDYIYWYKTINFDMNHGCIYSTVGHPVGARISASVAPAKDAEQVLERMRS
jgi:hypothetical protein